MTNKVRWLLSEMGQKLHYPNSAGWVSVCGVVLDKVRTEEHELEKPPPVHDKCGRCKKIVVKP